MIDIKKWQFLCQLQDVIEKHPEWAAESISAIQQGMLNHHQQVMKDSGAAAYMLLNFYLESKTGEKVTKEERQRALNFLAKYFRRDSLEKYF